MKFTDINVDGFGVWNGLRLEGLSDAVSVFYGPNEAGKTTLMQFVRAILYGLDDPRRRRYLPSGGHGKPIGSLNVVGANGRFRIERQISNGSESGSLDAGNLAAGDVSLVAADGTRQGGHLVNVLLSGIDESIFNNVFAVGLNEMQQLGTLGDTDAARMLYDLTAGLDRVSLADVMRELKNSRLRLLDSSSGESRISELLKKRASLQNQINEVVGQTRPYAKLFTQRDRLRLQITESEQQKSQSELDIKVLELAAMLADTWQARSALDVRLEGKTSTANLSFDALRQSKRTEQRLQKSQQARVRLRKQRREIRAKVAELCFNEQIIRMAPRIEILVEQESWILDIQRRERELDLELQQLTRQWDTQRSRLGLSKDWDDGAIDQLNFPGMASFRPAARAVRECRIRLDQADQEIARGSEKQSELDRDLQTALGQRGVTNLVEELNRVGQVAGQIRARIQLDERLPQLERSRAEVEEQTQLLLRNRSLPKWVPVALGGLFLLGVILVVVGFFVPATPTGSLGWTLAVLGLLGYAGLTGNRWFNGQMTSRRLAECRQQEEMLKLQIQQARLEAEQLDRDLSATGGPLAVRLQATEKEIAELQQLLPMVTRRDSAIQQQTAAKLRHDHALTDQDNAQQTWRATLEEAGLPTELTPKQLRDFVSSRQHLKDLASSIRQKSDEHQAKQRERNAYHTRATQLLRETEMEVTGEDLSQTLRRLAGELHQQKKLAEQRRIYLKRSRRLQYSQNKYARRVRQLLKERRELYFRAGVESEGEFREVARQCEEFARLQAQRDELHENIGAAIRGICTEQDLTRILEGRDSKYLEKTFTEIDAKQMALQQQLNGLYEQQGGLVSQQCAMTEDKRLLILRLKEAAIASQLQHEIEDWQVLAVTEKLLRDIRDQYESERQPETLREASGFLDRLTEGRYTRVWTPLEEDILWVDDANGEPFSVEMLSRGTREQLFLSLRLAIVSCYARRGAVLPLVLDDVLVNFDTHRAKAAAKVLRDFAKAGHQVLVFTCHEHVQKIFKSLKVDVYRLPNAAQLSQKQLAMAASQNSDQKKTAVASKSDKTELASKKKPAAKKSRTKKREIEPVESELLELPDEVESTNVEELQPLEEEWESAELSVSEEDLIEEEEDEAVIEDDQFEEYEEDDEYEEEYEDDDEIDVDEKDENDESEEVNEEDEDNEYVEDELEEEDEEIDDESESTDFLDVERVRQPWVDDSEEDDFSGDVEAA